MTVESDIPWGAYLGRPLGGAVLASAATIAIVNLVP
jgi:hypothetical protein